MTTKDRQFYEMIIKDAKRILPMVDESSWLCFMYECSAQLGSIIGKVAYLHHVNDKQRMTFSLKHYLKFDDYCNTPAWKSDRIFLLEQIIKYCEYKLKQS